MNFISRIFRRSKPEAVPSVHSVTGTRAEAPTSPRGDVDTREAMPLVKRIKRQVKPQPDSSRMYASAQVSRLTQDWIISITSANAETLVSAKATRARARELERDNAWMERILAIHENNVIGHRGIRLQMKIQDPNGKPDRQANKLIQDAWKYAGRKECCTVSKNFSRIEVQYMAVRGFVRDGGIILRFRRGAGINDFGFAVEPIEIDRLDHDYNLPQNGISNEIQFGVEMDKFKAPAAYHILTRHPGDVFAWRSGPKYRERVPADEVLFLFTAKRAGQIVGMPTVTSIMPRLNMLDKYEQAEAVAAFIASCKGGFFEKTNPDAQYQGDGEDGQGNTITQMEPGMIEELPPYMTYKANDPQHPTDAYAQFTKDQRRAIASGSAVPYNDLANDLEGVNFSSIRSGMLEAREGYKKLQQLIIDKLMVPWFEAWLPFAILSGKVPLPISKLDKWRAGAHWKPRRWPWVDPLKDVQADLLAIEGKLTSRRRVVAEDEDGGDLDELYQEIEEDNELAEDHEIDLTPAAKPVVASGQEDAAGNAEAKPGEK